ncbi:MAG: carbohydrate ABC transporter substrate-binding protein [Lachnospiraceae bacterium]|nr:carbohydrate ABC transporter substrate-binding protein [Lachnospiraceae bacterium]
MKKKLLSVLLSTAMVSALLVGCTSTPAEGGEDVATEENGGASTEEGGEVTVAEDTGKVLNIYVWNEEFKTRVVEKYPGYVAVDANNGTIGDVAVVWTTVPSDDNAYQNNLDTVLAQQLAGELADDDKIDLFLVEADYAMKYTGSEATLAMSDIGLDDSVFADQWQYTKDVVTFDGKLKGSSWQGCPGVLIYNRAAAEEVLGTQEPADVQAFVSDWDKFNETAATMKANGYQMVSSVNDTYRVYSNNVTSKWVEDGKINIDANIMKWVDDSKVMVDNGYAGTHDLWSDDWSKGFYPQGKVFCYFGPAWLVNFCMAADVEGSIGNQGGWGACKGPQGFFWGGTWMCAANGTDNPNLVADLIKTMTTDAGILKDIVETYDDFTNSQTVMNEMANSDYASAVFGGQNPIGMYCEGVKTIDLSNISNYDQGCNESFQAAMKDYFLGNSTKEEALDLFYKAVEEKYPGVTH